MIRIEGAKELEAALKTLSVRVAKGLMREALLEGAEPIHRRIVRTAPRSDEAPHLQPNINLGPARARTGRGEVAVGIGPSARSFRYDWFQEFGTEHHPAQPFYRPALDAEAPRAIRVISAALWRDMAAKGIQRVVVKPSMPSGPGGLV